MDISAIRQRCKDRLAALILPQPFDLVAFCAQVAAQRGRPIALRSMPLAGIAYGICLHGEAEDHILYELDTSPFHQQHIILHELSHLICGHQASGSIAAVEQIGLLGTMDLGRLRAVLKRASYSAVEEREAEILATLLEHRVGESPADRATPLSERLAASLDNGPAQNNARRGGGA